MSSSQMKLFFHPCGAHTGAEEAVRFGKTNPLSLFGMLTYTTKSRYYMTHAHVSATEIHLKFEN
jgi:P pilus assembly chaperone PapD